jgi:subtilisin family serine protease
LLKLQAVHLRSKGAGAVVAVIDSGIATSHPYIAGHLWSNSREVANDNLDNDGNGLVDDVSGWNFVEGNGNIVETPDDPITTVAGHGTFIGGLIAMLAPDCRIMPVRAFPPDGISDAFTVAAAVKYATDQGANIINLSLGSSEPSDLLEAAILDARSRGITVVAAVGNDGHDKDPQFPSIMTEVMAVAAIDNGSKKAYFSNYGDHVDVCAPGFKLISAFPWRQEDQFAVWSGTSFAAPLAAAEAALVFSADGQADVKGVVENTAVDINGINQGLKLGHGRIDPLEALISVGAGEARALVERRYQVQLSAAAVDSNTTGRATALVSGTKQEFTVEASGLNPRALYTLSVDGVQLAVNVPATNLGSILFRFANAPGKPLPAPINPVTKARHIEIDSGGAVVLSGDFSSDTAPVAGAIEREAQLFAALTSRSNGSAYIKVEALDTGGRRETLRLKAEHLAPETLYRFLIDGVPLGNFVQANAGFLGMLFTSDGSSGLLLPGQFRPVTDIRVIELQDSRGQIVVRGTFLAAAQPLQR